MSEIDYSELVRDILFQLASTVCCADRRLNERHLHHRFSCLMQNHGLSLGLDGSEPVLHPEWPTYKEQTGIAYARYKWHDQPSGGEYRVDDAGVAGYLDFAVGLYHAPAVAIEMTLKRGWVHEEIVFDLMKLLHPRMPFQSAASLNVLLASNKPVFHGTRSATVLISTAFEAAIQRLRSTRLNASNRQLLALFVEVRGGGERCIWRLTGDGQGEEIPLATVQTHESAVI